VRAVLHHTHAETPHITTFWFKPDRPLRYQAGQFTELRLPHAADDRGDKRWFTISSSPTDDLLGITTRHDPARPSSYKQTLFGLQPGSEVTLAEPMGDFVLPKDNKRPIVFVAVGIGVTPMHSMVKWVIDAGQHRTIHLLYAARHLEDMAFRKLFERAPIAFDTMLKQPPAGWTGKRGLPSAQLIAELPGVKDNALVYLAGPEPMIEKFVAELPNYGVENSRLVTDYFPGYITV
jgi:ferredoxin-NADP reductase